MFDLPAWTHILRWASDLTPFCRSHPRGSSRLPSALSRVPRPPPSPPVVLWKVKIPQPLAWSFSGLFPWSAERAVSSRSRSRLFARYSTDFPIRNLGFSRRSFPLGKYIPNFQIFKYHIGVFEYSDFQILLYSNIRISRYSNIRIFKYWNISIFKYANMQIFSCAFKYSNM